MFFRQNFQIETGNKKQSPPFSQLSKGSHQKQGQKLVLSDALAVQSQGFFSVLKNALGSQMFWIKLLTLLTN